MLLIERAIQKDQVFNAKETGFFRVEETVIIHITQVAFTGPFNHSEVMTVVVRKCVNRMSFSKHKTRLYIDQNIGRRNL